MNNKGQTLVIFIILLPLIILLIMFVFVKIYTSYEKTKQNGIIELICDEYKKNDNINDLLQLGYLNDETQDIKIKRINNSIQVTLIKETFLKIKVKTDTSC